MRYLPMALALAVVSLGIAAAPVATAAPTCTKTGPTTTVCVKPGSSQIVTSPPPINYGPFFYGPVYGSPYDGLIIGFP